MKDVALSMAARGFRVIPVWPGSKKPAIEQWTEDSYEDEFAVHEQWPDEPRNVGIHCKGFVALDVDVKNGAQGLAGLATLPPLPDTLTVRTPSGGFHFYFKLPEGVEVSNSSRGLPPGIDVRGHDGQCLAPGSEFNGGRYVLEKDLPPAPAPQWLIDRLLNATPRELGAGSTLGEMDTAEALERGAKIVANAAPAIEGQNGNDATYALSVKLWNLGISEDAQIELLDEWNERCAPPWDEDDLRRIIQNAREYNKGGIGRDNPLAGMEIISSPPNAFGRGVTRWNDTQDDEITIPRRPWLAPRRLMRGKITLLVAPGSIGKSLLTLQWAAAVALGNGDFCGLKGVTRTNTLVVNMEDDLSEMRMRLAATCKHFNLPRDEIRNRVHLWSGQTAGASPFCVARKDGRYGSIHEGEIVQDMIDYCREFGIGAIFIDPLVDTHECNENDNGEVQRVMQIYRRVATELDCAVVLVHHTKKPPAGASDSYVGSADAGRGASAAINAARIGLTLFNMNQKEGEKYDISSQERHKFVRLDDAKANLFLANGVPEWFKRETVYLANGEEAGVLRPADELYKALDSESRMLLATLAEVVSLNERLPVKTLAGKLSATKMFADVSKDSLVPKIIAACQSSEPYAGGKYFKYIRAGKMGGSIEVLPYN